MGRKKKLVSLKQSKVIAVRLTPDDYKTVKQAAKPLGLSLSSYLRAKGLSA